MGRKYDNIISTFQMVNTKFYSQVGFEKVPLLSSASLNVSTFLILFYFFTFSTHVFFIKVVVPRTKTLIYW